MFNYNSIKIILIIISLSLFRLINGSYSKCNVISQIIIYNEIIIEQIILNFICLHIYFSTIVALKIIIEYQLVGAFQQTAHHLRFYEHRHPI